jgi:hypothetical protein
MNTEYKATWDDLRGNRSKALFARHQETGRRISASKFYKLPGDDQYEREGYVLMTTRKPEKPVKQRELLT